MKATATKPIPATERQLRLVIPPAVWTDLLDYTERNAHDNVHAATRELIRQALVRERQAGAGQ